MQMYNDLPDVGGEIPAVGNNYTSGDEFESSSSRHNHSDYRNTPVFQNVMIFLTIFVSTHLVGYLKSVLGLLFLRARFT